MFLLQTDNSVWASCIT